MKRQGGFTLIELVVVIVILGILAVTAAPRFLNLQGDARESALQGLKGAMDGAAGIVYGRAAIEGKETSTSKTDIKTLTSGIKVVYGYPTADADGIGEAVIGLTTDWAYAIDSTNGVLAATFVTGDLKVGSNDTYADITGTECYVTYTAATGSNTASGAKSTVVSTKCK
ncbi:MSHA biogenesis protein MshA [Vibrio diazotrophicus]|nr:MSHA biogenesis protein MshA [Vibrio diazotrophicus]